MRWVGMALSGLLALACALALCGARFGAFCAGCHSPDGKPPLVGRNFVEGGPPFGTLWATNLTPAGEIKDWSDGDIIRAIREGVHKSGRALVVMPSEVFRNLSDADVHSIVAFLRSQPATGTRTPPTKLSVLAGFLVGAGAFQTAAQAVITQPVVAPPDGASVDYGGYLVSVLSCTACHGGNLAGGKAGGPGPPAGPNLTVIMPMWSADDFIKTIRTGVDPAGRTLSEAMPWKQVSGFATDDDLRAMHAYLHGLAPITSQPK